MQCQRDGPALLFARLWHEVGCRRVLEDWPQAGNSELYAEARGILTVLQRAVCVGLRTDDCGKVASRLPASRQ